jgi:hypothetical protein
MLIAFLIMLREGIVALIAAGILTSMVFWMRKAARSMEGQLHDQMAAPAGAPLGLACTVAIGRCPSACHPHRRAQFRSSPAVLHIRFAGNLLLLIRNSLTWINDGAVTRESLSLSLSLLLLLSLTTVWER